MFKFIRKHRLFFDITAVIVFAVGSYFNFADYFSLEYENSTKKGMDLFGGIVFGIMFIFKLVDVISLVGNRKVE
jgi:hypothetical protein